MDVIAANFPTDAQAAEAVRDLRRTLQIGPDRIELEHLTQTAEPHAGEPLIVVWVRADERESARELIERHAGRHVPFDWAQAIHEDVASDTISSVPRMPTSLDPPDARRRIVARAEDGRLGGIQVKRWRAIGSLAVIGAILAVAASVQGVLAQKVITGQWGWVVARELKTASYTPDPRRSRQLVRWREQRQANEQGQLRRPHAATRGERHGAWHGTRECDVERSARLRRRRLGLRRHGRGRLRPLLRHQRIGRGLPLHASTTCRRDGVSGRLAYAWADTPNAAGSYPASGPYQYDSMGGTITVATPARDATASRLPNLAADDRGRAGQRLLRTGEHAGSRASRRPGRTRSSPSSAATSLARSRMQRFTITYVSGTGLKGPGYGHQAYVFAKHPTTASYQPAAADRYSTSGQVPTVQRTGHRHLRGDAARPEGRRRCPGDGGDRRCRAMRRQLHPLHVRAGPDRSRLLCR